MFQKGTAGEQRAPYETYDDFDNCLGMSQRGTAGKQRAPFETFDDF